MTGSVAISMREELAQLARDMVRLDQWIETAHTQHRERQLEQLIEQRELVADHRFQLTRDFWYRQY